MRSIASYSIVVFVSFLLSFPAYAEITTLSSAINKAGRQRMLSQRMLKAHTMIGIDVDALKARDQLIAAVKLFDKQLEELKAYAPNGMIKTGLDGVERLWKDYQIAIIATPDREKAIKLLEQGNEVLNASHQVVLLLEDLAPTSTGYLINIAGRQRMLSQRLSMFYMYQTWGLNNSQIRSQFRQNKNEFKGALSELSEADVNTDLLKTKLRKGKTEWKLFKHGLDGAEKKPIPYIVNLTGDKLLKTMNEITGLYDALEK